MTRVVVVPCFNEEHRLEPKGFAPFFADARTDLLFVDDGSTDRTFDLLQRLCADSGGRAQAIRLERNVGKAEAVRMGMSSALLRGAEVVGYFDADLATPPSDMLRLLDMLAEVRLDVAIGSRVALMGARIERRPLRHYLGRVFATCASIVLGIQIYDTQCGAKAFRATPALLRALSRSFVARWAFDIELIGRLLCGGPGVEAVTPEQFVELPLRRWRDVGNSKLTWHMFPRLGFELLKVRKEIAAARRASGGRALGPRVSSSRQGTEGKTGT